MTHDRVALVTGASRGLGKGVALALGSAGYTVVVTGRSLSDDANPLGGTVAATAAEIDGRGGVGVVAVCDHAVDDQVAAVLDDVDRRFGRLDIVVNNAFAVPDGLVGDGPFWEKPLGLTDMFVVGLRSTYVTTWHAAPLLVRSAARAPLVVDISGYGAGCYLHGPAYGATKAGVDKLTHDMAVDLRPHGFTVVSLWPGLIRTERTLAHLAATPERFDYSHGTSESPEFTGRVVAALHAHPDKLAFTGAAHIGAELGEAFGVVDVDGVQPTSRRTWLGGPLAFHEEVVP